MKRYGNLLTVLIIAAAMLFAAAAAVFADEGAQDRGAGLQTAAETEAQNEHNHAYSGGFYIMDPSGSFSDHASSGEYSGTGWSYKDGALTLDGYDGGPIIVYGADELFELTIVLKNDNTITAQAQDETYFGDGIVMETGGKLAIKGSGSLTINAVMDAICYDGWSDGDDGTVNIEGGCRLRLNAAYGHGIDAGDVRISGCDIAIAAGECGIRSSDLYIRDSLMDVSISKGDPDKRTYGMLGRITRIEGGSVNIRGAEIGLSTDEGAVIPPRPDDDEYEPFPEQLWPPDESFGSLTISGGNHYVQGEMAGIMALGKIIVSGGDTRVEAVASESIENYAEIFVGQGPGVAIFSLNGTSAGNIEIREPLYLRVPVLGTVNVTEELASEPGSGHGRVCAVLGRDGRIAARAIIEPKDVLIATLKAKGKKSMNISWTQVRNADGYDIFISKCNTKKKKYKPVLVKSVSSAQLSWKKKGLKRRTAYKAYVQAYVMEGGEKVYVAKSPVVHAYTGGGSKKYTNSKAVKLGTSSVTLAAGSTAGIKASVVKQKKGKKLISSNHTSKLRYLSSNNAVATVNTAGVITAASPGSCTIYVLAPNGSYKKVAVSVG